MADEIEGRIDERPATYKKKLQVWLMIAFGVVFVLLLILTIINIISKMSGSQVEKRACDSGLVWDLAAERCVQAVPKEPTANRQDQFEQLVNARRPRIVAVEEDADGTGLERAFQQLQEGAAQGATGHGEPLAPEETMSAIERAEEQWKASERVRALESAKSGWGLRKHGEQAPQTVGVGDLEAELGRLNRPLNDSGSMEERRAEVRKRIEEAQQLRARIANQGVSGLPDSRPSAAAQAPQRRELQRVTSLFDSPPPGVVGYSKENAYNADIAGKIKMPPGTVIPTTLMWKSISDYTGGPLKAIVSHDVYDISREFVLVPKGTEVNISGVRAQGPNEVISSRMAFLVKDAVLPNGNVIDFSKAAAVDREGVGALEDQVDRHFVAQFLGVAAYALVGSNSSYESTGDGEGSYAGDVGEGARRQFAPLASKYLNIVPTVTIRPGQSFRVVTEEEMYIEPWSNLYAEYTD